MQSAARETLNRTGRDVWCRDHNGREYGFDDFLEYARSFHGCAAPGLILGGAMVQAAWQRLPRSCFFDVVCETRDCLPDAVQMLTLCTIGNSWLRIIYTGRFALTLYDKATGSGFRVGLDFRRLTRYPEITAWLMKLTPKPEQDTARLLHEIRQAGAGILSIGQVRVCLDQVKKTHKGSIGICPGCGEPYPLRDGATCRFCAGGQYYTETRR